MVTGESGLRNWIGFGRFDRAEWGGLNDTYKVEHFGGVRGCTGINRLACRVRSDSEDRGICKRGEVGG